MAEGGDFRLRDYSMTPERVDDLYWKFTGLEKQLDTLMVQLEGLTDDKAYDLALYLQTLFESGMDPAMVADLLEVKIQVLKQNN